MKIYIASSWKNQHGVEMLTSLLRSKGHEVVSWIENNYGEGFAYSQIKSFEAWVQTTEASKAFKFDTDGAIKSDLCIYYGPAGKDAAAEVGMAYASGTPILGLLAKGEDFGLMRKMMLRWFDRYEDLVTEVERMSGVKA